jgi:hypothetical protein
MRIDDLHPETPSSASATPLGQCQVKAQWRCEGWEFRTRWEQLPLFHGLDEMV